MDSEELIHRKAEAFDRIAQVYTELERGSGFASSSWVILAETLERELREVASLGGGRELRIKSEEVKK